MRSTATRLVIISSIVVSSFIVTVARDGSVESEIQCHRLAGQIVQEWFQNSPITGHDWMIGKRFEENCSVALLQKVRNDFLSADS